MSDSSASISALPGSCFSSCVTYSCTCSFCLRNSLRLTAWPSLLAVVGLQRRFLLVALGLEFVGGVGQQREPADHDHGQRSAPARPASLGSVGHWPGSLGLRSRNCDAACSNSCRRRRRWGLRCRGAHRDSHGVLRRCRARQRWPPAALAPAARLSVTRIEKSNRRRCVARRRGRRGGLDLDQLGLLEPRRVVQRVAQELGDALVGLRDAGDAPPPGRSA